MICILDVFWITCICIRISIYDQESIQWHNLHVCGCIWICVFYLNYLSYNEIMSNYWKRERGRRQEGERYCFVFFYLLKMNKFLIKNSTKKKNTWLSLPKYSIVTFKWYIFKYFSNQRILTLDNPQGQFCPQWFFFCFLF